MSRPIQFIPDLDSVANKQFTKMWAEETPIIRMMEHFGVSRTTVLTHALRAGLPLRNVREDTRAQAGAVVIKAYEPEIATLRCEACSGQYVADVTEDVECPHCGYPHSGVRNGRQQREA